MEKYSRHIRLFADLTSDLISQHRVLRDGEDDKEDPDKDIYLRSKSKHVRFDL